MLVCGSALSYVGLYKQQSLNLLPPMSVVSPGFGATEIKKHESRRKVKKYVGPVPTHCAAVRLAIYGIVQTCRPLFEGLVFFLCVV